jgi:hypothetical protein
MFYNFFELVRLQVIKPDRIEIQSISHHGLQLESDITKINSISTRILWSSLYGK